MQLQDYVGGGDNGVNSVLASAIADYIVFMRIQQVRALVERNIQEMVTAPTLWSSVPDPFDLSTDSRTWTHYVESVEFQARKVTWHVDPSIMRKQPRKNAEHTLSDVDRAVKRVGAWSRLV